LVLLETSPAANFRAATNFATPAAIDGVAIDTSTLYGVYSSKDGGVYNAFRSPNVGHI